MKKFLGLTLVMVCLVASVGLAPAETAINGAGASFPYPCYAQWAHKYNSMTGVKINYQSIGSGGGIAQIKAKTVDFGASDEPLKVEALDKDGLVQFPMLMGGVVPVINIKGVSAGQLKLSPEVLANIFLKKIEFWDDPAIKKDNADLGLPHQGITVVHRADGSGTTWLFTNYLSLVSKEWKEKVGNNKAVDWPTGVGAKGNEGVANNVKQVDGSIGYVEYAYAVQNKIPYTLLKNKAGKFVEPKIETFKAAAASADWKSAPGYYIVLNDQPGDQTWPIVGATFILVHKQQADAAKGKEVLKFLDWAYKHAGDIAEKLHYIPLPNNVVELVEASWSKDIKATDGKAIWP
jgi:phosphate transport system substrate-binding protein